MHIGLKLVFYKKLSNVAVKVEYYIMLSITNHSWILFVNSSRTFSQLFLRKVVWKNNKSLVILALFSMNFKYGQEKPPIQVKFNFWVLVTPKNQLKRNIDSKYLMEFFKNILMFLQKLFQPIVIFRCPVIFYLHSL